MARHRPSIEFDLESPVFLAADTPILPLPANSPVSLLSPRASLVDFYVDVFRRRMKMESMEQVDIEAVILSDIEQVHDASITDALDRAQVSTSRHEHFSQLIRRVRMDHFSLTFLPLYEDAFAYVLHRSAVRRIRYTLLLGSLFLLAKTVYTYTQGNHTFIDKIVLGLGVGVALPVIVVAYMCTFMDAWRCYCETYTSVAFVVVCAVLTAEKLLEHTPGPILPLFICIVPIFGVARLRFHVTWKLVAITMAMHLAALLWAGQENVPDICFQGFSYLGGIVGGAVAHYRVEVLRRRNFVLHLPLCADSFDKRQVYCEMKTPWASKHQLLKPFSLQFKHPQIEAAFYGYWYLIDGSPFQNIHQCTLHENASRTIRYAVQSTMLHQLLLAIQDWRYMYLQERATTYFIALALRLAVVGAYVGAQCLMKQYGQQYAHATRKLAPRKPLAAAPLPTTYVAKMQLWSACIVFLHALSMGLILVFFDRAAILSGSATGVAAPCYYLALLNAILFPHRSGFRVRFLVATIATTLLSVVFAVICAVADANQLVQYTTYVAVTLTLGMMISHEEESLRRSFFVRRAMRSHEFSLWHRALARIRPFVRQKIATRRHQQPHQPVLQHVGATVVDMPHEKTIPTSNLLATASKYGMYFDAVQAAVAACILAVYLTR
ncbi:Aste57867_20403 [Aphanomyces stellatus]|uniref:Aste57867_20403 protein n=1 Tax=Aphanomyces stellatus TaxID=120398 RepID=A0A485LGE5_9STRA|nr:hypothetical protein As57867_020337 [Aphanomyces stellatus]VFT97089.1 Aste57867_20403 [Aphanomyces stellatus]